jgi:3-oxo-5-alpha-steroid 4-dehydrogenase
LFFLGFSINVLSDSTLLSLKKKKSLKRTFRPEKIEIVNDTVQLQDENTQRTFSSNQKNLPKLDDDEAKTSYDIPYGGLFEYVSCANYCKYHTSLTTAADC